MAGACGTIVLPGGPRLYMLLGGEAGEPHDPCYHQACDTAENLSPRALDEMSDAAAQATLVLANEE